MSPWRPDAPTVFLTPAAVTIRSGADAEGERLDCAPEGETPWAGALARLAEWAARPGVRRPRVVVSNHWARYAVLPPNRGRLGEGERTAMARGIVSWYHGADWAAGAVRVSPGVTDEGLLAVVVPEALIEGIHAALAGGRLRARSIEPLFSWHVDRDRAARRAGRVAFACVEPGRVVVGMTTADGWAWIHSPLSDDRPAATLEREIARECALAGDDEPLPLCVFGHDAALEADFHPSLHVTVRHAT